MLQMLTLTRVGLDDICKIVFPASPKQLKNRVVDAIMAEKGNADHESALALTKTMVRAASTLD